jgi:hypothetical protein
MRGLTGRRFVLAVAAAAAIASGTALTLGCSDDDAARGSAAATVTPESSPTWPDYRSAPTPFAPSGATVVTHPRPDTGDLVFEALVRDLEARDITAILDRMWSEFSVYECAGSTSTYLPLAVGGLESVREAIAPWLAEPASLYAADFYPERPPGRGPYRSGYTVVMSASEEPSPFAPGNVWIADISGKLRSLDPGCDTRGSARRILQGTSLVPPLATCLPGEAMAEIEVADTKPRDAIAPAEIIGFVREPDGTLGSDRTYVQVLARDTRTGRILPNASMETTPEPIVTEFRTSSGRLVDVHPGVELQVHGWRFSNCVIRAWAITQD